MIEQALDPGNEKILSRLRRIRVFDSLSERQLNEVVSLSKIRKYEPGEVLIKEGDFDQMIYFLISGELTILSKGHEISRIRRLGDVFGEMGIIDGSPRSATIEAAQPTLCVAIDGAFIDRLEGQDKVIAQAVFYRIFAEILASRLRDTSSRLRELEQQLDKLQG